MNPSPADNSISQPSQSPVSNNSPIQKEENLLPQLQNETPMEVSSYPEIVATPSSTPESITSINSQELPTTPKTFPETPINNMVSPEPAPVIVSNPTPEPTPAPIPSSTVSIPESIATNTSIPAEIKVPVGSHSSISKWAILGGSIAGVIVVGLVSFLALYKKPTPVPTPEQNIQPTQIIETPVTTSPKIVAPIVTNLTVLEYKLKVDSLFTKYQNIKMNNPINLTSSVLSTQTVGFVSDEVFAMANEISELNLGSELKPYNNKLSQDLRVIVSVYDELLKTYKTQNTLSPAMKIKFTNGLKASEDTLKITVDQIKNLK